MCVALVSEIFVEFVQIAAESFGMTQAFVGFVIVALVSGAAEMTAAFSAARKDRLDLSISIALGSAAQIALFVAPVLVLASYVIGPSPMNLQLGTGPAVMILIATFTATLVTNGGRSAWFLGALMLIVYAVSGHDPLPAPTPGSMTGDGWNRGPSAESLSLTARQQARRLAGDHEFLVGRDDPGLRPACKTEERSARGV